MNELALIAERNQEAWAKLKSSVSGHQVFDEPFAFWTIPNRLAGLLQATRLRFSDDQVDFEFQLDRILSTYQQSKSPANWFFGPSVTPADLAKRFRQRHFMGPRYLPGMVATLDRTIEAPAHLVERCDDWDDFSRFTHPLESFFPKVVRPDVVPMLREVAAMVPDKVFPLITRIDGVPACGATVFFDADTIGVYDVVALPAYRGLGAGKSIVSACLRLGQELGAFHATLQAHPKATGLYEKYGFREVCRFTSMYYSRERSIADGSKRAGRS